MELLKELVSFDKSHSGGTGIRIGLKIRSSQEHVGSIPTCGTKFADVVKPDYPLNVALTKEQIVRFGVKQ